MPTFVNGIVGADLYSPKAIRRRCTRRRACRRPSAGNRTESAPQGSRPSSSCRQARHSCSDRGIARPDAGRREAAHQVGAELEVVEHAQVIVVAVTGEVAGLQVQDGNIVGNHFVVFPDIAAGANERHITTGAGKILAQLAVDARGRLLVVVQGVIRERVARHRDVNRPTSRLHFDRNRRTRHRQNNPSGRWDWEAGMARRFPALAIRTRKAGIGRSREGVHEIRVDIVAVLQVVGAALISCIYAEYRSCIEKFSVKANPSRTAPPTIDVP